MKTTLSLLALFILVVGGGYFYSAHRTNTVSDTATHSMAATTTQPASGATSAPASGAAATADTGIAAPESYTFAQVATHASAGSCWAAISGSVYNLTSWVKQHPGGEARILSICGKDGTSAFTGQHGSDPRAQAMLATFKIGVLAQ